MDRETRRRKKRIRRITINIIVLMVVITVFSAGMYINKILPFRGQYVRTVDFSKEAVTAAALWLSDVEGAEVTPEFVSGKAEGLSANVVLKFDGIMGNGTFSETLSEEEYNACISSAYSMTAACLRELIIKRLTAVGYSDSISDDDADALVKETFGMSLDNYIRNSGVILLPTYDEVAADYNKNGDYKVKGNRIVFSADGTKENLHYAATGSTIAISETGAVYRKAGR